jgi:hypothetical protein
LAFDIGKDLGSLGQEIAFGEFDVEIVVHVGLSENNLW